MQCPNCGRTVRSKTQCAHCGHVFDKKEVKNAKQETYTPTNEVTYAEENETRKSGGGVGKFIGGLVKLVLAVSLVFLAFLYGPNIISNVVEYFQPSDSEVVQNTPSPEPEDTPDEAPMTGESEDDSAEQDDESTDTQETAGTDTEQGTPESETDQDADAEEEETTQENAEDEEEDASEETSEESSDEEEPEEDTETQLAITESNVNLDNYPLINVEMAFDNSLEDVDSETFSFAIETNGNTVDLGNDYSLVKDDQTLSISFNDPALAVLSTEPTEQTLQISSEALDMSEAITYELPDTTVDSEVADFLNDSVTENLSNTGDVSAVIYSDEAEVPFVYDDQTQDAGPLISWFILAYTYNSINEGELTAEDPVAMNTDLLADNDTGMLAASEEGTEFTVQQLMIDVIHNRNASSMNHLIQANGGPNDFNLWLNESNFFATRVTQLINTTETGLIEGAVTNSQDVASLLNDLATNELVSEELDEQFKVLLLDSPLTEKYPIGQLETVQSRYEISSNDTNEEQQHYSAILEMPEGYNIVVIMHSNINSAAESVSSIANTINSTVTYIETGSEEVEVEAEVVEETQEEATEFEEAPPSQVEVIEEDPTFTETPQTPPTQNEGVFTSETGTVYGPDIDGDGFYDTYQNFNGEFVPIEWYEGEDGLWYFTESGQ